MKVLIIYGTRKGYTKLSSEVIKDILESRSENEVTITDFKKFKKIGEPIENYDLCIVGSSIVASFWKFGIKRFLKRNREKFRKLALFVSAGGTLDAADKGKMSKAEAIGKALTKYIYPVKKKYQLLTISDMAFGGRYVNNGKELLNSWKKEDVINWAEELKNAY